MKDKQIEHLIELELDRQQNTVELIASENIVSEDILEATGSILTNKYAEGTANKRFYNGCQFVDMIELEAIDRCKRLFGCEHVNVQPHSGSQANMAVYMSCLKVGDTILSLSLDAGGHLTHGSPANFSGKLYNIIPYGVDSDGYLDYEYIKQLALEHKPKLIVCGASNYSRTIDFEKFSTIAGEVGALLMADISHIAGLVATGLHPSPVPYADFVTTTTHKSLRGPRGAVIMCKEKWAKAINSAVFPCTQGGPLEHVIAAKAICFGEALTSDFEQYQQQVIENARTLASSLRANGLNIVSGGTDNHLLTLNLIGTSYTGKEFANMMDEIGITANKNTVPNDPQSPFVTSGVRMGTPAVTTRGFDKADMIIIGDTIADLLHGCVDKAILKLSLIHI